MARKLEDYIPPIKEDGIYTEKNIQTTGNLAVGGTGTYTGVQTFTATPVFTAGVPRGFSTTSADTIAVGAADTGKVYRY